MSTLRLYEVSQNYLDALIALEALAETEDLPPDAIADTIEGLEGEFTHKAIAVAAYIRNLEEEANVIAGAQERMKMKKEALLNHASRLRQCLKDEMERTGLLRLESTELVLRVQPNPPAVIIEDENSIPPAYKREELKVTVLKNEIRNVLKTGVSIPGVHLEQTARLVIS